MELIKKDDFEKVASAQESEEEKEVKEDNFEKMLQEMENPVLEQKKLAIKLRKFLNQRIEGEMLKGNLTENTRKWVDSYNGILEKIQKSLHGDKSVNLQIHAVSHSDIAQKIRESGLGK
jgi:hypothetical protein